MARLLALVVVALAALALAYPVAAQSDVTQTVWYSRFKQVAATFFAPNFNEWEKHISRNRINFVDTSPRDRAQQLLRTFKAMRDYQLLMQELSIVTSPFASGMLSFNLSSTGPYAWLTLDEYRASIGGLVLPAVGYDRGDTLSLSVFLESLDSNAVREKSVDYTARRVDNKVVQFAQALPAPVMGYGCKSSWAVVTADALSMYMQYQRAHSDKARARSHPQHNRALVASAQQLLDCARIYPPVSPLFARNPCAGNTLHGALEYITGRSYDKSMPGAAPSYGLNPLSRYGPALSRGTFRGSSDVYQSRGYCAAEQKQSERFFLDGSDEGRGYRDIGDLSAAIGYQISEANMELLLNYRHPDRTRGRTGPLISSVYAGSQYFQLYSGGIFKNIENMPDSCPNDPFLLADQPVLVMGYYNNDIQSYWVLRLPFGRTWGKNGSMKLAKDRFPGGAGTGLCGLGTIVGAFLPPNYQRSTPGNALAESPFC